MNNKGFAISGVLYTLLLLFFALILSILATLNIRRLTLDTLTKNIISSVEKYDISEPKITVDVLDKVIDLGSVFNVLDGVKAFDSKGLEITNLVVVTPTTINTNTPGIYEIKYNITDQYGNKAKEVIRNIEVRKIIYTYNYTGNYQEFIAPRTAEYKIELWGAQGGSSSADKGTDTGKGGYTSGVIRLEEGEKVYIYVGSGTTVKNGFNGGGYGSSYGGGATDLRLVNGTWDNFDSLKSRIMVAGGGGGFERVYGGAGGNLIGGEIVGTYYSNSIKNGSGGTQIAGGLRGTNNSFAFTENGDGTFGKGGSGKASDSGAGGGGGYYGGGGITYAGGGGGGSSFISGYPGSNAINELSTFDNIVHTNQPVHYSNKIFSDGVMKSGEEIMPNYTNTGTTVGNSGNGYGKITEITDTTKQSVYTYDYTGAEQKFVAQEDGLYNIEAWGASGGRGLTDGVYTTTEGKGAYTSGNVYLKKGQILYINVGGVGQNGAITTGSKSIGGIGGFNGGGIGGTDPNDNDSSGGGGGSTDIRLTSRTQTGIATLSSRMMVAAGGAGSTFSENGGNGGTLSSANTTFAAGATQTNGYSFGAGQDGTNHNNTPSSGAGDGYFGGFSNKTPDGTGKQSATGGSSFISGYPGVNPMGPDSISTNNSFYYSNFLFGTGIMKSGLDSMPNPRGENNITGNTGNGFVRITKIPNNYQNDSNVLTFNNTRVLLNLPDINTSTSANTKNTIEFWMYWDGSNNKMPIGGNGYNLWLYNNYFGFNTSQSDMLGISSNGLANTWVHVAAVFNNGIVDSSSVKLYINGQLQSISTKLGSQSNKTMNSKISIGGSTVNDTYNFIGQLKNVRVWSREISQEQIIANMSEVVNYGEYLIYSSDKFY